VRFFQALQIVVEICTFDNLIAIAVIYFLPFGATTPLDKLDTAQNAQPMQKKKMKTKIIIIMANVNRRATYTVFVH